MKLGLLADIHEAVEPLRRALAEFRREGVDQVVVLGDVCETGKRMEETCALLREAKAVGVWGNHDYGLCVEPGEEICSRFSRMVIDFMGSLRPRLEIEGCHFTHVEPWLDPHKIEDLWYYDGLPETPVKLARIFSASSHRLQFAGHFHQWLLATPDGILDWRGERPLPFGDDQRRFIIVGPLCDGHSAIVDTNTRLLRPCSLG